MENDIESNEVNPRREPILALILSFIFMGLGQAYNGQRKKGYLIILSYIALVIFYFFLLHTFKEGFPESEKDMTSFSSPSYVIVFIGSFAVWVFSLYDAYRSAKRINNGEIIVNVSPGKSTASYLVRFFVSTIIFAFVVVPLIVPLLAGIFVSKKQCPVNSLDNKTSAVTPLTQWKSVRDEKKQDPPASAVVSAAQEPENFSLMGTFFAKDGNYAIINGKVVKEGGVVDGATLEKISEGEVEIRFKDTGTMFRLTTHK